MIFWEMFMYHQNTLKILSLQYVVMFAVSEDKKFVNKMGERGGETREAEPINLSKYSPASSLRRPVHAERGKRVMRELNRCVNHT